MTRKIRCLKNGKAPGPDQVPNEVLKAGGEILAKHLHLLLIKVAGTAREPLEWKAGTAVPLYKKGAYTDPKNYRSIFLSDAVAKLSHSCIRDRLLDTYEIIASPTCFGGRRGKSTDMGHHLLQSFLHCAAKAQMPMGMVFLDLHSAFYHVLREGLFGEDVSESAVCAFLLKSGITLEDIQDYCEHPPLLSPGSLGTLKKENKVLRAYPGKDLLTTWVWGPKPEMQNKVPSGDYI